jgi:hypothetical protein
MVDWDRVNAQIEAVFGEPAQYAPVIGLPFTYQRHISPGLQKPGLRRWCGRLL